MRTTRTFQLASLLLAAAAVSACGGGEGGDAPPETAAPAAEPPAAAAPAAPAAGGDLVSQGQQIFTGNGICYTCHGPAGQGTTLAPDLTDDTWLWIDPAAGDVQTQMVTLIKTGVSQPKEHPAPMPANGGAQLDDAQVEAVAAYVISLGGVPAQ